MSVCCQYGTYVSCMSDKLYVSCHSFSILLFYRKPLSDIVNKAKEMFDENEDDIKLVMACSVLFLLVI
jgi:hypothetical protein